MYLEEAKALFKELVRLHPITPIPCAEEEVQAVQKHLKQPLPAAYKEFLLWMGHGFENNVEFLYRSNFTYYRVDDEPPDLWKQVAHQRQLALAIMELYKATQCPHDEECPDQLPEDAFVFLVHGIYAFMFFRLSEGDDPPVYVFGEDDESNKTFVMCHRRFSNWLTQVIVYRLSWVRKVIALKKQLQEEEFEKQPISLGVNPQSVEARKEYLQKAKSLFERLNRLRLSYHRTPLTPVPCSEEEVRALEKHLGRLLPAAYKEFLWWMGRGTHEENFISGSYRGSNLWEDVAREAEKATAILESYKEEYEAVPFVFPFGRPPERLPDDAFVLFTHEDYMFMFFLLSEGDDPPVYLYGEDNESTSYFVQVFPNFSKWLADEIAYRLGAREKFSERQL